MFVDEVSVQLRSGDGGAGVVSFRKMRGKPRGKPEGGSGGRGGDVIVEADPAVGTLLSFKRSPHRRAGDGTHGRGDLRNGRLGADLVLLVPVGTVIRDAEGTMVADLAAAGLRATLVTGGRGGRGNAALVGPERVSPTFAEQGEYGEEATFHVELKLVADAAVVGFPNAGKSTLLARVSAAKPKIADYPFTTLEPTLGVVEVDDREFVLADIPGLIEGAADGKGLGHAFLRHAERARVLLVLLDPSPLQEASVAEQFRVLTRELGRHSPALGQRPRLVAVNKADLPEARAAATALAESLGEEVLVVSAVTGTGIDELMHAVADVVDVTWREIPEGEGYVLHRPLEQGFEIRRQAGRWVVTGRQAERAVALDDLTRPEAADFAAKRLERAGVDDALRRLGAKPGDEVQIGDIIFEFSEPGDAQ